jgi:putative DNA primase/helicase
MVSPRPLYNLNELTERLSDPVLVVEGEKAADAARTLFPDYVVTTWAGGSNAPAQAAWDALERRNAVIWPDADEPGKKAAEKVAELAE